MCLPVQRLLFLIIFFLCLTEEVAAQYPVTVLPIDSTEQANLFRLKLNTSVKTKSSAESYIATLPEQLQVKGYPAASVDSMSFDSAGAKAFVYLGKQYSNATIVINSIEPELLSQAGWNALEKMTLESVRRFQVRALNYLENNGYPFANLKLDSIRFSEDNFSAKLVLQKGPHYKIDSIRVYGDMKISNEFLQRHLDIANGSYYRRDALAQISRKLSELPYVEESNSWNLTMLGTGCIVNLYLKPKKSSRVNVLIGLLPSNEQTQGNKLLVTGDADISLKNALGNAEEILLNWQQLQVKSPRLNLGFSQPYIFKSALGVNLAFELFKKDSSFLTINFRAGVQWKLSRNQTASIFFESVRTNLLDIDTASVKFSRKLPPQMDVGANSLGIEYLFDGTNYRLNPLRGTEVQLTLSAGLRRIKKNPVILQLYDPAFSFDSLYDTVAESSYRLFAKIQAAHYFQLGNQTTFKLGVNAGLIQSPSIFRNELFQIGGYRLLRGFDEQSIYVSGYAVSTAEFRYLISRNSYLFSFIDAAATSNRAVSGGVNNRFFGAGLGLALETKAGVFNISYAAGKRNDLRFDIRQSKIHIGYVNYF